MHFHGGFGNVCADFQSSFGNAPETNEFEIEVTDWYKDDSTAQGKV